MKLLKTLVAATAAFGVAATAQAGVTASGHVSFQIQDTDGVDDLEFRKNGFSESRFRFNASKKIGDQKLGIQQEFGLADENGTAVKVRRNNFWVSGGFGKVSLGVGNDVGDGAINADLAGTNLVTALSSNSAASGVGANGFDPGRGEALRYYSPKLGGIAKVGVQIQENGGNEIVVKVDTHGFRFNAFVEDTGADEGAVTLLDGANAAAAQILLIDPATADASVIDGVLKEGVKGSSIATNSGFLVGYKHSGFSITYVASTREQEFADGSADLEHTGYKLGYAHGKHRFSVSGTELELDGLELLSSTGFQYLNKFAKGVDIYAGMNEISEELGLGLSDKQAVFVGARVKF